MGRYRFSSIISILYKNSRGLSNNKFGEKLPKKSLEYENVEIFVNRN